MDQSTYHPDVSLHSPIIYNPTAFTLVAEITTIIGSIVQLNTSPRHHLKLLLHSVCLQRDCKERFLKTIGNYNNSIQPLGHYSITLTLSVLGFCPPT